MPICRTVGEIWPFSIFQNGSRPPSWICYASVWATHEKYLVVFVTVNAKFVSNWCSTFYNMQSLIFRTLSLKMPIYAQSFFADMTYKMGCSFNAVRNRHTLARKHVIWRIDRSNPIPRINEKGKRPTKKPNGDMLHVRPYYAHCRSAIQIYLFGHTQL